MKLSCHEGKGNEGLMGRFKIRPVFSLSFARLGGIHFLNIFAKGYTTVYMVVVVR